MSKDLIGRRVDRSEAERERWRPEGRPVRLALVTWPVVALMGATVATAACLLSDCGLGAPTQAKETLVGHAGTIRSIGFRPDGAMLSSVGFDGSIKIWELTKRPENLFQPRGSESVRCAAFSPDNRVLAVASQTAAVALHDLVNDESRTLEDANKRECRCRLPRVRSRWGDLGCGTAGRDRLAMGHGHRAHSVDLARALGIRRLVGLLARRLDAGLFRLRLLYSDLGLPYRPRTIGDQRPEEYPGRLVVLARWLAAGRG